MKNILLALRSLTKRGQHNILKIASLSIGMAVGLLLVAKIWFEQSYDDFYPDSERVWQVYEFAEMDGKYIEIPSVSGGVVVGMREMFPEIESSTRRVSFSAESILMTESRKRLAADIFFADSCYFDVLPRPVLLGDAKETLSRPGYAMVSRSMAEAIGGDVVGKTFTVDEDETYTLTIGGVFEDLPENSSYDADIFLSMETLPVYRYDMRNQYMGNDSFKGYIKLRENASVASLTDRLEAFKEKYLPMDEIRKMKADLNYTFHRIDRAHAENPDVRRSISMLSLIAFALLFTGVMNYILIVVSSIVNRTREIAVRKTYGASSRDIHAIVFSEAAVHTVIALIVALLILLSCREMVYDLVGVTLPALLKTGATLILSVTAVILLITGLVPGTLLARIPVAAAFRNIRESKRAWKLCLLLLQFTAASFLVIMLLFVSMQYHRMVNDDPGYEYKDVAFAALTPSALQKAESVLSAIAPDKDIQLYSYADEFLTDYDDTRKFRDAVLIGGVVTLAIVFIGLVGYTMDEVNRRSKEMAIRKINGASIKDIMRLFLGDVLRMALPAVVIGCLVAYIVLREWLQQYAEKVALGWYYFAAGGAAVLLVVLGVAAYNVYDAATENPVRSLKSE